MHAQYNIISPHALRRRRVRGRALVGCGTWLATPLTYVAARGHQPWSYPQLPTTTLT